MSRLRLRLLGGFDAQSGAGEPLALPSKKAQALIAYLAVRPGETCSRERLLGLLWSTRSDEQARNSLRQTLSSLRKCLGNDGQSPLLVDRHSIALDPRAVEVDVVDFEQSIAAGDADNYGRAAALYGGEFLDGIRVRDPAGDEWLFGERERLRGLAVDALTGLLTHQMQNASTYQAIATAKRLLGLDPLQEPAYRALMRLYTEQGQRPLALKTYQTCRDMLQSELQVEPDTETEELSVAIRNDAIHPARGDYERENEGLPGLGAGLSVALHIADGEQLPLPEKPSIAVLTFSDLSEDGEQGHLADGISEDISYGLTRFRDLFVSGRSSASCFSDKSMDVTEIGRQLGVQYLVQGTVRKHGHMARITAELVDATSGQNLWGERYDRALKDVFTVQDEVANAIVATLAVRVEDAVYERSKSRPPEEFAAYDWVLRGNRCVAACTKESLAEARRMFQRALEVDPEYAAAYVGLSKSYLYEHWALLTDDHLTATDRCIEFGLKAMALDDADSRTHYALGHGYFCNGQIDLAEIYVDRAVELNPSDYHNLCFRGYLLAVTGRFEECSLCLTDSLRRNPFAPNSCLLA